VLVGLLVLAGSAYLLMRPSGKNPAIVPPTTATAPLPTPTGFGDATATVGGIVVSPTVAVPPSNIIGVNGWVQVANTGRGLVVRANPSKSGARLTVIPDGTKARVIDGPKAADGITWWKVDSYNSKDPSASGWCASTYLTPTSAPSP
jgi:hypothetical protein